MNLSLQLPKHPLAYRRLVNNVCKMKPNYLFGALFYTTTIDAIDVYPPELVQRHAHKNNPLNISVRYLKASEQKEAKEVAEMTIEELDTKLVNLILEQKDKQLMSMIKHCIDAQKLVSQLTLERLFRHYSIAGKPDMVEILQQYCLKIQCKVYKRNGQFMHYLAKAQCMKGNSEKGLTILKECYNQNEVLRSFYRLIFRELIQDSVLNRSEASLVIFKKFVLDFSTSYGEHYPLVCLWHICWSSSWFSDQMLAKELFDTSKKLQDIVKDKATAFSITILRQEFNDDAVLSLLQMLLGHDMMDEYVKVLLVLFDYKLKNRDVRGCTEIIKNCEVLDIALPPEHQGRYIRLLIDGKAPEPKKPARPTSKTFKLKF